METFSDRNGVAGSVESLIGGRKENQDSYGMSETRLGMLVVVCDGMGGGPAGKTASTIATQAILDYVSGSPDDKSPVSVLEDAGVAANEAVMAAVAENPALKGMGTTCVCLLVRNKKAYIMHVGDSRCYQLRAGKAVFRTSDHSYVGELVRRGTMSEEDARNSKYSNVITRAVGTGPEVVPEVDEVSYKPGDRFALMSDGIWGAMPEPQLVVLLCSDERPAELVVDISERVDAIGVENGGGHDNLTLAVVDMPGGQIKATGTLNDRFAERQTVVPRVTVSPDVKKPVPEEKKDSPARTKVAWVLGVLLFVAIGVISYLLIFQDKATEKASDDNEVKLTVMTADSRGKANPETKAKESPKDGNVNKTSDIGEVDHMNQAKAAIEQGKTTADTRDKSYLEPAISKLKELLECNKKEQYKTSDKVDKMRRQLYDDFRVRVKHAAENAPDAASKEALEAISAELRDNKVRAKMLQKDSKQFFSTKEARETINQYIVRLSAL